MIYDCPPRDRHANCWNIDSCCMIRTRTQNQCSRFMASYCSSVQSDSQGRPECSHFDWDEDTALTVVNFLYKLQKTEAEVRPVWLKYHNMPLEILWLRHALHHQQTTNKLKHNKDFLAAGHLHLWHLINDLKDKTSNKQAWFFHDAFRALLPVNGVLEWRNRLLFLKWLILYLVKH